MNKKQRTASLPRRSLFCVLCSLFFKRAEKMMKYAIVLLIAALVLAGCGVPSAGAGAAAPTAGAQDNVPHVIASDSKLLDSSGDLSIPDVGGVAPDFQYTLSDGTVHKLSEL